MTRQVLKLNVYNRAYATKPPISLVRTWLDMARGCGVSAYNRQRAIDLIQLIFGSVEFAERYVVVNTTTNTRASLALKQATLRLSS